LGVNPAIGLGQGGQGIDRQEQRPRLLIRDIENFHLDFHIRVEVAAEMPVDQFQPAVGQFIGQQAPRESHLVVQGPERSLLPCRMAAEVHLVGNQIARSNLAMTDNAIFHDSS
jgi:hypothetical protein